ncbi:MAG: glycosyltransferase family 2 protein [Candidatus Omnitrophica bacterium]|nr:glycosyltransferase family 2 protein [Candidatus Omnitrophota bacterium]
MSNRLISIIIATAGKGGYLISCLESLNLQSHKTLETIVIDNSSDPELRAKLCRVYPQITVYRPKDKLDFCRSMNLGIASSSGEFVLCLNDDVTLDSNFIESALKGFQAASNIGMVSGKILRPDGKTIDSTGLFVSRFRTAGERGYNRRDKGQFDEAGYVFGASGACAFYRKEMLGEVKAAGGYFDEDYGFFYEDLDIAWRAQRLGWKGYYVPQALAYHARGATARSNAPGLSRFSRSYLNDELHFDLIKNRYLTVIKNEKLLDLLSHLPFLVFYDLLSFGYLLIFRPKLFVYFFTKPVPVLTAVRKRFNSCGIRK